MTTILLDEAFYKESDNEYLDMLIRFIDKYFNVSVSVFRSFSCLEDDWITNNMNAVILKKIQKTGKFMLFNTNSIVPSANQEFSILNFSEEFIGKINYLHTFYDKMIIPVTTSKHEMDVKQLCNYVYIINHVYNEIDSNIACFICDGDLIDNICEPDIKFPLPNHQLCNNYYGIQRELVQNGGDKIDVYSRVAKEVAKRNTYSFSKELSIKNKVKQNKKYKTRREIYCKKDKSIYLSVDFESGCFELYNSKGKHQGEISYTGEVLKQPDKTGRHNISV